MVLWGTDNLKTEGAPIGQALALIGAHARASTATAALAGADARCRWSELGRPRIDVVITLSGIFRDLMPLQIKLLAEAAFLAATADEPPRRRTSCASTRSTTRRSTAATLETAALRVFGNADGAYGSNVNNLDREQPLGGRGRTRRDLLPAQGLRLRPQRPAGSSRPRCCRACWPTSS
jgi:magnesium chelatase subunit H